MGVEDDQGAEPGHTRQHRRTCADNDSPPGSGLRPRLGLERHRVTGPLEATCKGDCVGSRSRQDQHVAVPACGRMDGRLDDRKPRHRRGEAKDGRARGKRLEGGRGDLSLECVASRVVRPGCPVAPASCAWYGGAGGRPRTRRGGDAATSSGRKRPA